MGENLFLRVVILNLVQNIDKKGDAFVSSVSRVYFSSMIEGIVVLYVFVLLLFG